MTVGVSLKWRDVLKEDTESSEINPKNIVLKDMSHLTPGGWLYFVKEEKIKIET